LGQKVFENALTNIIVVILVLGFMIFIHELGHFLAAKAFGIRVLVFSLGFGKRLLGFRRGETDYRLSVLPFGGYVKMAGDDPTQVREGKPGEFLSHPRWQRFFVVIMGPAMNVGLAVLLLGGLYHFHHQKPAYQSQPARIGDIAPDSPAAKAGFRPGDLIVRFDGLQNPKWEDVQLKVLTTVNEAIPVEVVRNGETQTLSLTPLAEGRDHTGDAGWSPALPGRVDAVEASMPAGQAGLQPGDEIVALDGQRVYFWPRIAQAIQEGGGKEVALTVARAGQELEFRLQPVLTDLRGEKVWRIGVSFRNEMVIQKLPWGEAISASLRDNLRNSLATFDVLGKILTRRMSARSLTGPIGIAQLSGEAYRAGWPELIMLTCFISLQLGIFNLLPIPVLDGGVILLLLVESAIRRDLSLAVKERFAQVGVVFLLLLAAFVMVNDILKSIRPS
jgi:regulator of sigma E protease